jgi:winged helix DNA-binding protein
MKTVRTAAKWLDGVGVAALLPGADLVLPSLWEAITGTRAVEWGIQREDGKFEFTPEMARCWQWKDELPAKGLALVGKHFGRWAALVAPRLIPHAWTVAAERRTAIAGVHVEIVEAVREHGALTVPQLRTLVPGAEKKHVEPLQRAFVLTNSHLVEQSQGWAAIAVDLVERLWDVHEEHDAELELARTVLASSGELSAADLGGALGWRVKRSREVLEQLDVRIRTEHDVQLYSLV